MCEDHLVARWRSTITSRCLHRTAPPTEIARVWTKAASRQIFRRFLDTTAKVNVAPDGVHVHLPRRAHNPLLLEAGLLMTPIAVPWWGGASLKVVFP